MNPNIENLKSYLETRPVKSEYEDVDSLLELLYYYYTEENPIENAVIRYQFMEQDKVLNRLTVEENDLFFRITCDLCTEHARRAFVEGLRVGGRLFAELSAQKKQ